MPPKRRNPTKADADSNGGVLLEDKTDMTFLDSLMEMVRVGSKEALFNKHQLKLLRERCGSIHRTLQMMQHTAPAPNTLSAFRSAEHLVTQHIGEGWETFLVHRFTAKELFESVRTKIRLVWSLQSTARWEQEDDEAAAKDAKENIALMRTLDCISLPTIPSAGGDPKNDNYNSSHMNVVKLNLDSDEEVLHFYQRRAISGWKLPWHQVDCAHDGEVLPGATLIHQPPTAGGGGAHAAENQRRRNSQIMLEKIANQRSTGKHRRYFRRPEGHEQLRFSFAGLPLTCVELPGSPAATAAATITAAAITPRTLENFIVDMKCRHNWIHPNLVKCVGGFAEKFHSASKDGEEGQQGEEKKAVQMQPHLSLGAWFEDLEHKAGYVSLHELLYNQGRKYHISTAIQMVLLVADALQYIQFTSQEVSPEIVSSWMQISPSRIFVSTDEKATSSEVGLSKTVDRVPGMQGECHVRFCPSFFVEDSEISRWAPPVDAANPACYALTQLLCCLLTNSVPFVDCTTQDDIARVRGGVDYQHTIVDVTTSDATSGVTTTQKQQRLQPVAREEEPDSPNLMPTMVPKVLREFLSRGLVHKKTPEKLRRESEERKKKDAERIGKATPSFGARVGNFFGKMFMAGISVDVAEDDGPQPFITIQQFRRDLTKLARESTISSLCHVSPHVSKVAAAQPAPPEENVHLGSQQGLYDDEGNGMAVEPSATAGAPGQRQKFEVGLPPGMTVPENEIHKGHDIGPIGDYKNCFDYGYPSQNRQHHRGASGVSPLTVGSAGGGPGGFSPGGRSSGGESEDMSPEMMRTLHNRNASMDSAHEA